MTDKILTILLVEHDHQAASWLQKILRGMTIEVVHASGVDIARELLDQIEVDLVLLDLFLTDSQGLDTLHMLQDREAAAGGQAFELPTIVLVDAANEDPAEQAVERGAHDYLVRDQIDKNVLQRSIRYVLERNRLVRELQESRELEHHLAYHDFLTGLPNRLLFHDRLKQALSQAQRFGHKVALLFLDLDGFKRINDTLGHTIGDRLLRAVAQRLENGIRDSDTVARLGGDEFTIILFGIHEAKDAARVARKILRIMSAPFRVEEHELFVTASIGVSMFPDHGRDVETLIKRADIAMYRAKGSGKNNHQHYTLSMDASFFEHLTLENSLRRAIENDELVVYYQPQVDLRTGEITGLEALVRWQHPVFGLVSPAKFIPLAEETGIIVSIDEWVMQTACRQTKSWNERFKDDLQVAVNLSARQFRRSHLPETVSQILEETKLSPRNLCLEITESNVMQNVEKTISVLDDLKKIGLDLSVDDFGTGYSSLNYLKRFPIDVLKVDRAFVGGIPLDRDDMAISTAIVVLAQSMALKVVAEGVETVEQLSFFKSLNCDSFQGYYFSRPVTTEEITIMLENEGSGFLKSSRELQRIEA
ncbi:EAL domain-containing protein [candidate division KSB1 bacterium]|nr:EAL domain-containing protein [candidate division KSB1 bacterium]